MCCQSTGRELCCHGPPWRPHRRARQHLPVLGHDVARRLGRLSGTVGLHELHLHRHLALAHGAGGVVLAARGAGAALAPDEAPVRRRRGGHQLKDGRFEQSVGDLVAIDVAGDGVRLPAATSSAGEDAIHPSP